VLLFLTRAAFRLLQPPKGEKPTMLRVTVAIATVYFLVWLLFLGVAPNSTFTNVIQVCILGYITKLVRNILTPSATPVSEKATTVISKLKAETLSPSDMANGIDSKSKHHNGMANGTGSKSVLEVSTPTAQTVEDSSTKLKEEDLEEETTISAIYKQPGSILTTITSFALVYCASWLVMLFALSGPKAIFVMQVMIALFMLRTVVTDVLIPSDDLRPKSITVAGSLALIFVRML